MSLIARKFEAYVEQLTGQVPAWQPWVGGALPGYLAQRYEARLATLAGQTWLIAFLRQPDAPAPLQLLKQLDQLQARIDLPVAGTCLVAEHLAPYLRTRLVELGQPFVVPGRQLFWPAIGSAETVQRPQRLRPEPVDTLGPVAQQLLIALLLRRVLPPLTITTVAQALGWTAASVSQAVKALEASGLVESRTEGRERIFALADAPGEVWRQAQPLLRTPVRQRIRIRQADLPPDATLRAGESALATLSDLTEPAEPVFAVASRHWPKGPETPPVIPTPDTGTCVVELWRYPPDATATHGRVDPLSLYLSLKDAKDERLQLALERLMEQVAW